MKLTEIAPKIPISSFKRTKIIATLGPSTDNYETVRGLIEAGANGLRLNFSHGTQEDHGQRIKWARKAAEELGKPVAIIQDLQGPKIRLGDFDGVIDVQEGQTLRLKYNADYTTSGCIPIQYDLSTKVKKGERLYIYDGKVRTKVTNIIDGEVHVLAENDGIIMKRKGMNLPDTNFGGDIITKKDRDDIKYGFTQDIDYVAMSFVQTADDIEMLRKILSVNENKVKIIAKIETAAAVDNIEDIVKSVDAVMVARGDLAVETPAESVPIVQRRIIGLGMRYSKPTIVATQMLASMTELPDPTRAEVSDVATAVLVGADCLMLSEETAAGHYPIEAVQMMKRVIRYTEDHAPVKAVFVDEYKEKGFRNAISDGIISLAKSIEAKAIIAETKTGNTALRISSHRPEVPLIVVTDERRTAFQLALVFGVKSYLRPAERFAASKLIDWLESNKVLKSHDIVVTVSGQKPGVQGTTDTIKVRVLE